MAKVRFFTQKMIDQWSADGKVEFDGVTLTIKGGNGGVYELSPATMFLDPIEGKDSKSLKGKVLNSKHIQDLKADVYLDSALVGEVAYKVEPGFIVAKMLSPGALPDMPQQAAKPAVISNAEASKDEKKTSADLADLVIKALSD